MYCHSLLLISFSAGGLGGGGGWLGGGRGEEAVLRAYGFSLSIYTYIFVCHNTKVKHAQLAFFINLHRAVIGPSASLTGR